MKRLKRRKAVLLGMVVCVVVIFLRQLARVEREASSRRETAASSEGVGLATQPPTREDPADDTAGVPVVVAVSVSDEAGDPSGRAPVERDVDAQLRADTSVDDDDNAEVWWEREPALPVFDDQAGFEVDDIELGGEPEPSLTSQRPDVCANTSFEQPGALTLSPAGRDIPDAAANAALVGSPSRSELENLPRSELFALANANDVEMTILMDRHELIEAIIGPAEHEHARTHDWPYQV